MDFATIPSVALFKIQLEELGLELRVAYML
jgi:ABC-type proline/glycine betaine transport system permease subunit